MGRTLPTATMLFMQEQDNFSQFQRALRRSDQLALDDLFVMARNHTAAAAYAANALPMETFLLAMLLEEHKEVIRLRTAIEKLESDLKSAQATVSGKALFSYP
jgi:uncharacterized protein YydD (DUF2326 family)